MKRPLRKLIAFSSAAAVLTNALAVTAFAAHTAVPVSDAPLNQMIQYPDRTVYVQNSAESAQLIVIGSDGKKQTVPLEQNTVQLLFSSQRQFRGGTNSAYAFNYDDPAFLLAAKDNGCLIASVQDGEKTRYRLVDSSTGKSLSPVCDDIKRLSPNLYQITLTSVTTGTKTVTQEDENGEQHTVTETVSDSLQEIGLMNSQGTVILQPDAKYKGFSPTKDEQYVLVSGEEGFCFFDLSGKAVSKTYKRITSLTLNEQYGWGNWWFPEQYDAVAQMTTDVYCFTNEEGNCALGFGTLKPTTPAFKSVEISGKYDGTVLTADRKQEYQILCKPADGSAELRYNLDGSKAKPRSYVYRLDLRTPDGNRPYLYMEEFSENESENEQQSGIVIRGENTSRSVVILDENEQPLPDVPRAEGGIAFSSPERLVLHTDSGYLLYNAGMELLGSYDEYIGNRWSKLVGDDVHYAFQKDGAWSFFDENWNAVQCDCPKDFGERYKQQKENIYYWDAANDSTKTAGYIVKTAAGSDAYTWELWDADYNTVNTFTFTAPEGGSLTSETDISTWWSGSGFNMEVHELLENGETLTFTEYYALNSKLEPMRVESREAASGCGEYYCIKNAETESWQLTDKDGKALLDKSYPKISAYVQETDGKTEYYYAGITDTDFTVYDSNCTKLCTVSGTPVSDVLYKSGEKYGFYSLKTGAVTEALYSSADKNDKVSYFRTDDATSGWAKLENRVYPLSADGKIYYFDGTGKVRRELASTAKAQYNFSGSTYSAYLNKLVILNDKTENDQKGRSYVYDAVSNTVLYEQTGIYDSVKGFKDGYAVTVSEKPLDAEQLWTNGTTCRWALVRAEDGAEVIPLTGNLSIYSLEMAAGQIIYPADTDKNTLCVCVRSASNEYVVINIPVSDIDTAYAQKHGYDLAVPTGYGNFAAMKDGLWCLADAAGKQITAAKYARIYGIHDAMAVAETVSLVDYEANEWETNPETGEREMKTVTRQRYNISGKLITMDGRTLIKAADDERLRTWISDDGSIYGAAVQNSELEWYSAERISRKLFRRSDFENAFAKKNGYDTAVQYDDLYVVQKGCLCGIVDAENNVIVPVQYPEMMAYTPDEESLSILRDAEERAVFTQAPFSTPLVQLGDGNLLATFKKTDGTIDAYLISGAAKPGDMNGDGTVNLKDVVLLRRYIAGGWNVTVDESKADMNGDGKVNLKDVVLLRRIIAGGY